MRLAPPSTTTPLGLLLASEHDDLESLSIEELRYIRDCERQRLGLTKTVGKGAGVAMVLAAGRLVRR